MSNQSVKRNYINCVKIEHKELRHLDRTTPRITDSTESSLQAFCAFSMQHQKGVYYAITIVNSRSTRILRKSVRGTYSIMSWRDVNSINRSLCDICLDQG